MASLSSSTPPVHSAHSDYRPDIDGLRALAVLAVIAFHASARILPGGYAGVDIFFVISGYLISSLIIRGMENKSFRFTEFYTRRIKRILPAYIVVALVTLVVASFLLIPNDYIFYTTSLAASWAFLSNVFFSMLSWGYFGQRTEEFPLLHTWSLSVEEQFYFLFPLLLLFGWRFRRAWLVVALVTVSSFAAALLSGGFYNPLTRAWEFGVGSLLALAAVRLRTKRLATAATQAGIELLVLSCFVLGDWSPFPSVWTLLPVAATALLLVGGSNAENVVTQVLSTKPFVRVGDWSY